MDSGTGRLMVYPVWERQSDAVPSAASGLPTSAPNGARPRVSQAHEDDLGPAGASERREVELERADAFSHTVHQLVEGAQRTSVWGSERD